jgi:hypothetical protein
LCFQKDRDREIKSKGNKSSVRVEQLSFLGGDEPRERILGTSNQLQVAMCWQCREAYFGERQQANEQSVEIA